LVVGIPAIILLMIGLVLSVVYAPALARYWGSLTKPKDVLVFDGLNRIVTPVERFAPVTLETWVRPEKGSDPTTAPTYFIGGDIYMNHGIGLGMTAGRLHAQYLTGVFISKQIVPMLRWSHVAAVFASDETRLYFNGQLVETGPPTKNIGGAPFVVGCLGEDSNTYQFVGQIRSVRISAGERYLSDFVPENSFEPDADDAAVKAVLIYDGTAVDGEKVIDLSGNANHGDLQKVAVNKSRPSRSAVDQDSPIFRNTPSSRRLLRSCNSNTHRRRTELVRRIRDIDTANVKAAQSRCNRALECLLVESSQNLG